MKEAEKSWAWVWTTALAIFLLAASTGSLMRFGLIYGFPGGWQYTNIRHAHSHLMYFGWVTPALMGLILHWLPTFTKQQLLPKRHRQFKNILIIIFILSFLAYVSFFFYGYRPAVFGTVRLPTSTILASFNIIAWYRFGWLYWQETKGVVRKRPLRFWDASLIFLLLASMGAWGIALTAVLQIQSPVISAALTHLFLDLFAEGWFALAVLGLIHASVPLKESKWLKRGEDWLIMGMPVIFLLGVPTTLLPTPVRLLASLGAFAVAIGLWIQIVYLWNTVSSRWRAPLIFLGIKATANLAITIPAIGIWAERANLRISYLHWLLLGYVTLALVAAARAVWGKQVAPHFGWLTAVVTLLILSLTPLTGVWPAEWHGLWTRQFAAWATLGPILIIIIFGIQRIRHNNSGVKPAIAPPNRM